MFEGLKKNLNEFKTFAVRGNVVDMAVGIIIGAAFGKIHLIRLHGCQFHKTHP